MAGFSDLFSQDGLNALMADPRMRLGLAMMAQGRQGSSSQALGQAGGQVAQMMTEQQRQQQLSQHRQQMSRMQQDQLVLQQQNAQRKADAEARQQAAFQNPDVQAQMGPLARMLAAQGLGVDDVLRANAADNLNAHRDEQLQQQQSQFDTRQARIGSGGGPSGPRMPTQRQVLDQPLGNGMMQRNVLNPQTGQYEPYGEPFNQYSPGRKSKAAAPVDDATAAILGAEPAAAEALPGNAPLASYAPGQPQQPVGVLPMTAAGSVASSLSKATADARVPGQPKVATPMTKAEYDALPPGTQYIDPVSGRPATKRG